MATVVLGNSYGRTTATGTGVLLLRVRAYYDYGYGRTTIMATGVLRLRLRANVRAYYTLTFYCIYRSSVGVGINDSCMHRERKYIWWARNLANATI